MAGNSESCSVIHLTGKVRTVKSMAWNQVDSPIPGIGAHEFVFLCGTG
jgi:hypothetical protein